jgi:hypothetical protein
MQSLENTWGQDKPGFYGCPWIRNWVYGGCRALKMPGARINPVSMDAL